MPCGTITIYDDVNDPVDPPADPVDPDPIAGFEPESPLLMYGLIAAIIIVIIFIVRRK